MSETEELPPVIHVLRQTDDYVFIAKPSGLMVHRSELDNDRWHLLQTLRDQLDRYLYPVHRLDRAVSGCLVMAFSSEWATVLQQALAEGEKTYVCQVRGTAPEGESVEVDTDVRDDKKRPKSAHSVVDVLGSSREPRTSLMRVRPTTGRYHQVRRHVRDLSHPILGDSQHGDTRVNRHWREQHGLTRLALHCLRMTLPLPDGPLTIVAPPPADLVEVWETLPFWSRAVEREPALGLPPLPQRVLQ